MHRKGVALLKKHEGFRSTPYLDTVGKWTIGYGRNLEDVGISRQEALYLLRHDIGKAEQSVYALYPFFDALSQVRQAVLVSMAFNLGRRGLSAFHKMRHALEMGDYDLAAHEMLDSKWAKQVGARAYTLARMMQEDRW